MFADFDLKALGSKVRWMTHIVLALGYKASDRLTTQRDQTVLKLFRDSLPSVSKIQPDAAIMIRVLHVGVRLMAPHMLL